MRLHWGAAALLLQHWLPCRCSTTAQSLQVRGPWLCCGTPQRASGECSTSHGTLMACTRWRLCKPEDMYDAQSAPLAASRWHGRGACCQATCGHLKASLVLPSCPGPQMSCTGWVLLPSKLQCTRGGHKVRPPGHRISCCSWLWHTSSSKFGMGLAVSAHARSMPLPQVAVAHLTPGLQQQPGITLM